jgi:antitoxin component YwqK of YwqJK toxin-antitoxin module
MLDLGKFIKFGKHCRSTRIATHQRLMKITPIIFFIFINSNIFCQHLLGTDFYNIENKTQFGDFKNDTIIINFDSKQDTISVIQFIPPNKCVIKPYYRDTNILEYFHGYYDNSRITLFGDYYYNDKLIQKVIYGQYFNNIQVGLWKYYYKDNLSKLVYMDNVNKNELNIRLDMNENIDKLYYKKNGSLNGSFIEFDNNSQIIAIGEYVDDCRTGRWIFYENNKINIIGLYYPDYLKFELINDTAILLNKSGIDATLIYHKDVIKSIAPDTDGRFYIKDGVWEYYSETGETTKKELYDKGRLVKTKTYKIKKIKNL